MGPLACDSSGNVFFFKIKTKKLKLKKLFNDGNFHNFLDEEYIICCYLFQINHFFNMCDKKQNNHWKAWALSFPMIMLILVTPIKKMISLK